MSPPIHMFVPVLAQIYKPPPASCLSKDDGGGIIVTTNRAWVTCQACKALIERKA